MGTNNAHIFYNKGWDTEQWGAGGMLVTWSYSGGTSTEVPMLMTGVEMTYQRASTDQYPVNVVPGGNMKRILINGMPSGGLRCQTIIGPTSCGLYSFLERAGKPCGDPIEMQLQPYATTCQDATGSGAVIPVMYYLKGVVLDSFSHSVSSSQAGIIIVSGGLNFSFTEMTISGGEKCNNRQTPAGLDAAVAAGIG